MGQPGAEDIQQRAEEKAHHKAEQIGGHKAAAQNHQRDDQRPLEQIGPGAQRQERKHQRNRIGKAGHRRDAQPRIDRECHGEAVDDDRHRQGQLTPQDDAPLVSRIHALRYGLNTVHTKTLPLSKIYFPVKL